MRRRRSRQLQLSLRPNAAAQLPKDKEREVVDALAELLLAAVQEASGDEEEGEDERQDHD